MSTLVFGNPLGLWALLAIPAVLAIHFLQPRSRRLAITTLFLLEHLPPLATTGRAWRWLRSTWALWLQLAAVLLITWLLCEPRWQRPDSVQTIVVLLDASASMRPFRDAAVDALESRTRAWERRAARTEWIVRETHLERPVLFRGFDRAAALASLSDWRPDLGHHDFDPALEVARQLVRRHGAAVLVSDRAPAQSLDGVALLAVGKPLENVGFAGGSVDPASEKTPQWTILVQHHGRTPATRTLTITPAARVAPSPAHQGAGPASNQPIQRDELTLEPGQLLTLTGSFPTGVDALTFTLTPDEFDLDDTLPLVVPVPRPLTWRAIGPTEGTAFFRKFLERTPGLTRAASGSAPDVSIYATNTPFNQPVAGAALIELMIYTVDTPADRVVTAPVVSDSHPWIDDLTWSGLLGPGPATNQPPAGARALLWQGEHPLAWTEMVQGVPRLVIGWNWPASNAERLPASAVLLHRVIEDARARKFAPETRNVDTGQLLHLPREPAPGASENHTSREARTEAWWLYSSGGDRRRLTSEELATLRAPAQPGFFEIRWGDEILLRAAAQFADSRETDFASAETRAQPTELPLDVTEANAERDHLRPVWLLLLLAVLLGSWAAQAPGKREVIAG